MLQKTDSNQITLEEYEQVRKLVQNHLDSGMSPSDIKKFYNLQYTDFGMFIKTALNLKLKHVKDAVNTFYQKNGRSLSNEKTVYYQSCQFSFNVIDHPNIPGLDLLLVKGMYHSSQNPTGVSRDHMISIAYGWKHKIDPEQISHPANCQILLQSENSKKGSGSCLSLEELENRITNWNSFISEPPLVKIPRLPFSDSHRKRLSEANIKVWRERKINNLSSGGRKPTIPYDQLLKMIADYGVKSVAEQLGISVRAVHDKKRRALAKIFK